MPRGRVTQPGHLLKCRETVIQRKQISTETLGKNPISYIFLSFQKPETLLEGNIKVLVTRLALDGLVQKEGEMPTIFRISSSFFKIKGVRRKRVNVCAEG